METIVFIGCNKSGTSRDALKIAKKMGYYVVLITNQKKHLLQRSEFPEVDQLIYKENMEESKQVVIALKRSGKEICACLSFVDPFVTFAAKLQEEMGLFSLSTDALFLLEDKIRFREALCELPSSPFFSIYDGSTTLNPIDGPVIIKPPASNGSKDVILVRTNEELQQTLKTAKLPVLIEEFLEGPQFLIEVVVHDGNIHIVAIIEQEITNGERFIVTGYQYPALLELEQEEALRQEVASIIRTVALRNGSCHLEMRFVNGKWRLIEINPRMSGGAMNRIILAGTGINLVQEIIQLNTGKEPIFQTTKSQAVYAKFITVQSRGRLVKVTGRKRASRRKGVIEVYVKPKKGTVMTRPMSLGNRYAYVIATGETVEEAKANAVNAAQEIRFIMERI